MEKIKERKNEVVEKDGVVLTPIPSSKGFDNYLVDTINGRVWSVKSNKWLSNKPNDNGYVYVKLYDKNNKGHGYCVSRVVMASYSGLPLEMFKRGGIEVDHIDEDLNHVNGISNLQMTDRKGQYKPSTIERMKKPRPRISEEDVCLILEQLEEWIEMDGKVSDFIKMTCEAFNRDYRGIWNIVHGKSFKHLHEKMSVSLT
ncbi:hypothetical protein [Aquibacillus kalidii]|uniref:hypothetical protein n=1 Tax=Aquibacillus kalidii TaxID=2762597 RepID=UPI001648F4BD|nr:hypothetical protein [Aquibacillus kalidii]